MSTKGRYRNSVPDLLDEIKALKDRISALERTPQAPNAAINKQGMTLKGGSLIARAVDDNFPEGPFTGLVAIASATTVNGEFGMQTSITRSDAVHGADQFQNGTLVNGNAMLRLGTVDGSIADPNFPFPTIEFLDKSGNVFMSDTTKARRGMGDPILHMSFTDGTYKSSTSTGFAFIMSSEWYMYHPHLRIRVLVQNDAGNSSEIRVSENGGNPSLGVTSIPAGAFAYFDIIVLRSQCNSGNSGNGNVAAINLEHRRVAGAGTIRTQIISVIGIDLSWFNPY